MNKEYFEALYNKYFKLLHAYSFRIVLKEEVAEDIVQEVFMECWTNRKTLNIDDSLKPYLFTLARRKSIDQLRKADNKNIMLSEFDSNLDQLFFDTLVLDDQIDADEMELVIISTIKQLPPKCKDVFLLSREKCMKNREIAETLDLNIKTVEKHITKALKEIKTVLENRGLIASSILSLIASYFFIC